MQQSGHLRLQQEVQSWSMYHLPSSIEDHLSALSTCQISTCEPRVPGSPLFANMSVCSARFVERWQYWSVLGMTCQFPEHKDLESV